MSGPIPNVLPAADCDGVSGMAFFGATASIVVAGDNQVVTVSGTTDIGSAGSVTGLNLDLCYESALTGFVAEGLFMGPLSLAGGSSAPHTLSRSFALAPATYSVGLCACIAGADSWASNFSVVSVQLFQK